MTGQRVPALDGLRAAACFGVVAIHTGVPHSHGGWLGVDIFFVLSGYLITGILLDEQSATGRVALGRFWGLRLARLYPALLVTAFGVLVASSFRIDWLAWLAAIFYFEDFRSSIGHKDGGILGHTWSLAIEEQFYVLWPLVIAYIRKPRLLLGGTAACAGLSMWLLAGSDRWGDFRLDTRVWSILAGCALALILRSWQPRPAICKVSAYGAAAALACLFVLAPPPSASGGSGSWSRRRLPSWPRWRSWSGCAWTAS